MASLSKDLADWFEAEQRELPWREGRNPYHIWVSEIMLQQTQVATVIPYYERFLGWFPTIEALAEAPEDKVLKAWEGLGYYSRARHLQAGARLVVEHHAGRVPSTWEAVRRLPGVGDYTAGAILSIAFSQAVPAVDGNVMRVLSRLHLIQDDVQKPATKRRFNALAAELLQDAEPSVINQALMELGALVCTPSRPRCETCPVKSHCRAFAAGVQEALPVKEKKTAVRNATLAIALLEHEGAYLLTQRPQDGIWGGLWAFPTVEVESEADASAALLEGLRQLGVEAAIGERTQTMRHTLTHRQLSLVVYRAQLKSGQAKQGTWTTPGELARYALPVPYQKLAASLDLGPLFRV